MSTHCLLCVGEPVALLTPCVLLQRLQVSHQMVASLVVVVGVAVASLVAASLPVVVWPQEAASLVAALQLREVASLVAAWQLLLVLELQLRRFQPAEQWHRLAVLHLA